MSRRLNYSLLVTVCFALVLGQTPIADALPASNAANKAPSSNKTGDVGDLVRPDPVSAMVTARATGKQVEVLSERTGSMQVYALPDGTWKRSSTPGPVRMQDAAGDWHDLNPDLQTTNVGLEPKYATTGLVISNGGDRTFASIKRNGHTVAFRWPSVLPTPVVDGATATFAGAAAGGAGDLVVTATQGGFQHEIVLRERPTGPVKFSMPVGLDGGRMVHSKATGRLTAYDKNGKEVATGAGPLMWDASKTSGGDPANVSPVSTDVSTDAAGATSVNLSPSQSFLADPSTIYPVVIDPSYTVYPVSDTWMMNTDFTSSQYSSQELRAGTYDNGTHLARSFLKFSANSYMGQHVLAATLRMRNWYSASCTGSPIRVNKITASWNTNTVTWATQPSVTTADEVDFSPAYGSSGCAEDYATWDVTNMIDSWASGAAPNYGLRVRAYNEAGVSSWRKYRSVEYSNGVMYANPQLIVISNHLPTKAVDVTLAPTATYVPPGGSTIDLYTADTTPQFTSHAADGDGGNLQMRFEVHNSTTVSGSSMVGTCTASFWPQGKNDLCSLSTALPNNASYYVRAKAYDGKDWAGGSLAATAGWSDWTTFKVGSGTPSAPTVTCPSPYTNGSWTTALPSSDITCTVSAAASSSAQVGYSAPGFVRVAVDGQPRQTIAITPSTDPNVAKTTVTVSKAGGAHSVTATAVTPAGAESSSTSDTFGYGAAGISVPAVSPQPVTTGTIAVTADGPPKGISTLPTAAFKWRVGGSGLDDATGWNTIPGGAISGGTVVDAGSKSTVSAVVDTAQLTTDSVAGVTLDARKPNLIDLQVCLTYITGTQCTWSQQQLTVLRVAHAFGSNFPTSTVPGGQVALWTGEVEVDGSDAAVTAPSANLSISRTAASFAGPPMNPNNGVFGPGWSASLDGPDAGLGDMTLIDNTRIDGTLDLVDGTGEAMVFGKTSSPSRRSASTADLATGTWVALDEDTQMAGTKLVVTGTGSSTTLSVTEDDGTVTTYTPTTAPAAGVSGVFSVAGIDEAGTTGSTTYSTDSQGRVTRMLAPVPNGVTCPPTGNLPAGCRALTISYATSTTATSGTPGDYTGQVKEVDQIVGAATQTVTALATYKYDTTGHLVSTTDPRTSLTTSYAYDGTSDRIATITPPGQDPITYVYDTSNRLSRVKRVRPATDPAGGTATLDTIVYNIPTSGHTGLPNFGAADVAVWDQDVTPTYGAAVFGPNRPLSSAGNTVAVSDVDADASGGAAWADADLTFTDSEGRVINTAANGAGAWQFTSTSYDSNDNVVRSLDQGDIASIKSGDLLPSQAGDITVYNNTITDAGGAVILPYGSVVTDSYQAARWIRDSTGNFVWARPHTHTDYDQGAPHSGVNPVTGQRYALATTVRSDAVEPSSYKVLETYSVKNTDYTNAISGDTDAGWTMGLAATTTTDMTGSAGSTTTSIVSQTRYDATGRVISTQQPKSTGSDAGTRKTYYYTVGTNPDVAACGNKPEWAGLTCQTTFAGSSPSLVTTTVSSYDGQLNPLVTVENVGAVTRTTTNTYRTDGQIGTTSVATSGLTGSTAIGDVTYNYSSTTGQQTGQTTAAAGGNPGGTISSTFDTWGRQLTYVPATGETTTTNYNSAGDVSSVVDPQGTTTYTYNGTDAAGNVEHRGLVTKLDISRPSASDAEITGAYDASGSLVMQKLPGGVTQRTDYDAAGEPIAKTYSGSTPILDPDTGAQIGTDPDGAWLGWFQDNDGLGRVRREWTPVGAAFTGDTSTGAFATGFSRDYTYDRASRLVEVKDQTVPVVNAGDGIVDPDDTSSVQAITTCEFRDYSFDGDGNRTGLTRTTGALGAGCPTPGGAGAVTKNWAYDAGDRLTAAPGGGSYNYDAFGRVTTLPQTDTPAAAAGGTPGNATLAYYDNDLIKSITQNGSTTAFGLDAAGRRSTATTTPSAGSATTITRHYIDRSDNPGWTSTVTGTGSAAIERFGETLDGDLGLSIAGTSVTLDLADLHGDTVSTVTVPSTGSATGIDSWTDSDEYGNPYDIATVGKTPTNTAGVTAGVGYGWLGGKQRATDTTGLELMGVRVYDPISGQFTSSDPVVGGNTTSYAYPQDPTNGFDVDGRCWHWCDRIFSGVKATGGWVNRHAMVQAQGCIVFCASVALNHGRVFTSFGVSGGNWKTKLGHFVGAGITGGYTSTPLERTNPVSVHGCVWADVGGCLGVGSRGRGRHRHAAVNITGGVGEGFAVGLFRQNRRSWRLW